MKPQNEIGLVLCGGGGRGAYQIGVWKALRERGFDRNITAVSGTSVGALNAALFACGDLSLAENIWISLRQSDIADPLETAGRVLSKFLDYLGSEDRTIEIPSPEEAARAGLFSSGGLISLIERNGVNKCVSGCGMPCFACCHNASDDRPEYFDLSALSPAEITEYLTASTAIPAVFPAKELRGSLYRDGGLSDNTPVKPLYGIGLRKFVICYLGSEAADLSQFPDAEFLEIFPSEEILLGRQEKRILKVGTLDFDGENAARRIELGYAETQKFLGSVGGSFFQPRLLRNIPG